MNPKPILSRRRFLRTAAIASLGAPAILRSERTIPSFEIGLVADAQYADIDPKGTRFYRQSIAKLGAAVEHFNGRDLACCVHLGDLIDREWRSFDEILRPLTKSRHRWHQLLGNHDFDVLDEQKPRVPGRMGMARRYYSFDHGGIRFAVLDTNDVSTYAHAAGTPEKTHAEAALKRYEAAKLRQAKPWNGGIGAAQLAWLDRTCAEARALAPRRAVAIFAHHPVWPEDQHNVWNAAEVLAVLDRHPNVVAWINGHNHAGHYAERRGVHFLTLRGMVETADTTAFATAQFVADRLLLTGHGREPSRELSLRWPEPL
jgi:3',5'-cyclic AMP phosphodiesterase CpdA